MTRRTIPALLLLAFLSACSVAPTSPSDRTKLHQQVEETLTQYKAGDPPCQTVFPDAYAYAVFPAVTKGAAIVGWSYGRGELYENGALAGYCDLRQTTFAPEIGLQGVQQILFFQTPQALAAFKIRDQAFAPTRSEYRDGVMSAVHTRFSQMSCIGVDSPLGTQSFRSRPLN